MDISHVFFFFYKIYSIGFFLEALTYFLWLYLFFFKCILGIASEQTFLLWFWNLKDVMKQKYQQTFWSMLWRTSSVKVYEKI